MDVARKKIIAPHVRRRIQEIQPSTSHPVGCSIPAQNPILYLGADLRVWQPNAKETKVKGANEKQDQVDSKQDHNEK